MSNRVRSIRNFRNSLLLAFALPCLALAAVPTDPATISAATAPQVVADGLRFPEGTILVEGALYFVDYGTSDVMRQVGARVERVWHEAGCGANGLVQVAGGFLVACFDAGTVVRISTAGRRLDAWSTDDSNRPLVAPNDLAATAQGGVYITCSGNGGSSGRVVYLPPDGKPRQVAEGIGFANGVALSPDGRSLYVGETTAGRVLQYRIGADGSLSDRQTFVTLADSVPGPHRDSFAPDGIRTDSAGRLFIALYRGGGIVAFDATGRFLAEMEVPGAHHTNLAISADGSSIFVTSIDDSAIGHGGRIYRVPNPLGATVR